MRRKAVLPSFANPAFVPAGAAASSGATAPVRAADRDTEVGLRIRTLRRARGWTQEQLAAACGVTRSAIAQWESGRAGQQAHNLLAVAQTLAVDIDVLRSGGHLLDDPLIADEEQALLGLFRRCTDAQRELLLGVARNFAGDARIETPSSPTPGLAPDLASLATGGAGAPPEGGRAFGVVAKLADVVPGGAPQIVL